MVQLVCRELATFTVSIEITVGSASYFPQSFSFAGTGTVIGAFLVKRIFRDTYFFV